jgi:soluble lytic murein transglycosylase-like protein
MTELEKLARERAEAHSLDPDLVCAIVEQESGWEPLAIRYEPAFQKRYVEPLGLGQTETVARSISWGLLQLMGQAARELGFKGHMGQLLDPAVGLEWGCKHFANKLARANGNVEKALLYWNGGSRPEYAKEVMARVGKYKR